MATIYLNYTNNPFTFAANNFMEMANKITPKTFLIIPKPFTPINFSIFPDDFNTPYTKTTLINMAIMILILS